MKRQTSGIFPVVWVAVTVILIGLVLQLRADEHAEPNESGWVQTNGPYGGRILALHEVPKGVLFAGTIGSGIFRSTDRGDTWAPVNTGLDFETERTVFIRAFAHNGGLIYAGASDALYRSTDGGESWHKVPIFGKGLVSVSGVHRVPRIRRHFR